MAQNVDTLPDKTASPDIQPAVDFAVGLTKGESLWVMRFAEYLAFLASQLSTTFSAAGHGHTAAGISNSTEVGRAVLTAADAAAVRVAISAEALLSNRTALLKIGEDVHGAPTWNGASWPGVVGGSTELILNHPSNGTRIRFFVNDSNNADWEVLPPL